MGGALLPGDKCSRCSAVRKSLLTGFNGVSSIPKKQFLEKRGDGIGLAVGFAPGTGAVAWYGMSLVFLKPGNTWSPRLSATEY